MAPISACNRGTVRDQGSPNGAGREFWRRALLTGGTAAIPRWSVRPVGGVGEHVETIPEELGGSLGLLADELGVGPTTLGLAAHAKVLASLAGERDIVSGYEATEERPPLPCPLTVGASTWRDLVSDVRRVEAELLAYQELPLSELKRELGLPDAPPEVVWDATGADPARELGQGTVLRVAATERGRELELRLRYRTEALDAGSAARIAGYYRRALELMTLDPGGEHQHQSLLGAQERELQLEGFAGPPRTLPACRVHELFEQQAAATPDTVAVVHAGREVTYGELNQRANRVARALLARGLRRERPVAVITERNLDWVVAVLAVFKAGGVYLPIEPHFPPDRIARTLTRAECELVLTEPASTGTLDQALATLPAVDKLFLAHAYEGEVDGRDLRIAVASDQLAYIYFTSGSTGEPKGAMCEHAGMLNHLYAKLDDLEIREGAVVAQTAPQCFDISLWQLLAALLVGGRTVVVEQDAILDVQRFVDTIATAGVNVVQVVPSYLEVVLSYLEQHPRELPDLRCVSVTGEALKKELAQRWFTVKRNIKLVNAYGLTETSDDTNHEVMERAPEGDRVPLGPPVNNVRIYIVDEHLSLVPLGSPGEIVFSGVCVGRGYVNDPERTRQAFMSDPYRKGERLYRSGDYGRWRPDGKLEFLGRRDSQVKVSGFRIEIGEIENALLRVPGVRDAAVVVAQRAGGGKSLVGIYSGKQPIAPDLLKDRLGESLPEYMVPSVLEWRERLPLTANGKIDKNALAAFASELESDGDGYEQPRTPTEERLAAAWAKVLGVAQDQIGRHDHFFDRGGTSLSAVRLAIALDRSVSLKDLTRHPILADLAALLDGRSEGRSGLLQMLSDPDEAGARALVCFPYAGGNAVNFQSMAAALRGSGLAVYAVELPGHDLAGAREPFVPISEVVERVVAELSERGATSVLLWGHSSGTAFAVATASALQERGIDVERLFLAAQLPGDAGERRAATRELNGRSDGEIAAGLSAEGGYMELGELDAQRAEHIGAAYRHDCVSAHRYLAGALDGTAAVTLSAPVTVVLAADDPHTPDGARRYRDWGLVADRVDLHEIATGGHYFLRTRPGEAARVVLDAVDALASC